jgi:hypothetical protein
MQSVLCVASALCAGLAAAAEPATFTRKPTVTRDGDQVRIAFAVSAPTDVAVTVEDGNGRVVRHLVAGVLGQNPPAPLAPNSLAQTLVWDGKDDVGGRCRVVGGGAAPPTPNTQNPPPFVVRVRLGLKPEFEDFMLFDRDATPEVQNVAVAPGGNLYLFYRDPTANGNQGGVKVRLIDRQGRHVRQIVPFAADLPYEKVKATGAFRDADGRTVPNTHNWHSLSFYPDTIQARGRSLSPFACPVADATGRLYWIIDGGRLVALDADGGVPYPTYLSDPLFPMLKDVQGGRPALVLSTDGQSLYAAGIATGGYERNAPVPCVFRIDLTTRQAEVFLGKPEEKGASGSLFTSPRGLALAGGLLYVADPDANRVAVFNESTRELVGELKVELPHIVQVHPTTGAVYVCTYVPPTPAEAARGGPRHKDAFLIKFARGTADPGARGAYTFGRELYRLALPRTGLSPNAGTHRVALDASTDPPLLWAPGLPYGGKASRLSCYRDTGSAFERQDFPEPTGPWGDGPRDLLVDRARGDLYIKVQGERWRQFEERSGKLIRTVQFPKNFGGPYMGSAGAQLAVDSAGNYITHCWGDKSGLMRWSRDLKPLNWLGQETHRTDWGGMMTFQLHYLALRNDQMYVIKPVKGPHHLEVYDFGLNVLRRVVWNVRRGSNPRVDARGNVYITVPARPLDRDYPEFFDDKLPKMPDYVRSIGEGAYWYAYMYGSLVKFPPEGGAFQWAESEREKNDFTGLPDSIQAKPRIKFHHLGDGYYPHKVGEALGAEWLRFGYAPYAETYSAGTPVCMCEGSGFDVDPFGRVFYPNLCQFRVEVLDTNGNAIGTFGRYGNVDAKAEPGYTPLAWTTYVAVSDTHAYVNDTVNMRVARVRLGAAAEETASIP